MINCKICPVLTSLISYRLEDSTLSSTSDEDGKRRVPNRWNRLCRTNDRNRLVLQRQHLGEHRRAQKGRLERLTMMVGLVPPMLRRQVYMHHLNKVCMRHPNQVCICHPRAPATCWSEHARNKLSRNKTKHIYLVPVDYSKPVKYLVPGLAPMVDKPCERCIS